MTWKQFFSVSKESLFLKNVLFLCTKAFLSTFQHISKVNIWSNST